MRTTSRVVPMAVAASFSSASRLRARCWSVLSKAAMAVPTMSPEVSRTGHTSMFQACARDPEGVRVKLS